MGYAQPRICPGEWHTQTPVGFLDTNGSRNRSQTTRPYNNQSKKQNLENCEPGCHSLPQKESEKKDKDHDRAKEWKKLWEEKVTFIPIVIGPLGTITKGLIEELVDIEIIGRVEIIKTTALLKSARILKREHEASGDLLSLNLKWKTIGLHRCEKFKEKIIIKIILLVSFYQQC